MVDRDAIARKYVHRDKVLMMDRTNWTRDRWVQDAFDIMADPDGSSISLMNGHVRALLSEVEDLRGKLIETGDTDPAISETPDT